MASGHGQWEQEKGEVTYDGDCSMVLGGDFELAEWWNGHSGDWSGRELLSVAEWS